MIKLAVTILQEKVISWHFLTNSWTLETPTDQKESRRKLNAGVSESKSCFTAAHIHTVKHVIQSKKKKNCFKNQNISLFSSTAKLPYSILIEAWASVALLFEDQETVLYAILYTAL